MFGLFNKKPKTKVRDMVWMSQSAKYAGLVKLLEERSFDHIVAWFPDTIREFQEKLIAAHRTERVKRVSEIHLSDLTGKKVLMLEHYPISTPEKEVLENWKAEEVIIATSLDEPLLKNFGSDNIISMMKKLGMKEDETIEHGMITSSIRNAQEKLEKKVGNEMKANSAEEWFTLNVPREN